MQYAEYINRKLSRQVDMLSFFINNYDLIFIYQYFFYRYNPASVLQIDLFQTSEEKFQDQLTKTMSVVFEGIVELGGASAEVSIIFYLRG
jgi:hypothetical protein